MQIYGKMIYSASIFVFFCNITFSKYYFASKTKKYITDFKQNRCQRRYIVTSPPVFLFYSGSPVLSLLHRAFTCFRSLAGKFALPGTGFSSGVLRNRRYVSACVLRWRIGWFQVCPSWNSLSLCCRRAYVFSKFIRAC